MEASLSGSSKKSKPSSSRCPSLRKKDVPTATQGKQGKLPVLKQLNMYKQESQEAECLLCNENYRLPENTDNFLSHLVCSHHFVIADTHCIAYLKG